MLQVRDERNRRLIAMGQMAASLAHEIRNPLGSMELFCSLLLKDLKTQPEQHDLAQQIYSGIRTLEQIIANCLQFSRDLQPRCSEVPDLNSWLVEVSACLDSHPTSNLSVSVVTSVDRDVRFDPHLLAQVLRNLLLNAADAAGQESAKAAAIPKVLISAGIDADNCLLIRVEDNGAGIAPEHRQEIFDPFYSTKTGGTGLGLAISHSIVTAHGGSIEIYESDLGGAGFVVRLPQVVFSCSKGRELVGEICNAN